jgi:hypothetical protein
MRQSGHPGKTGAAMRLAAILAISLGVVLLHHYAPQYIAAINAAHPSGSG